jgi:hypothetical protein
MHARYRSMDPIERDRHYILAGQRGGVLTSVKLPMPFAAKKVPRHPETGGRGKMGAPDLMPDEGGASDGFHAPGNMVESL